MSKPGSQAIAGLLMMLAGVPMRQTVVRRMKVKGKTVWAREAFTAPAVNRRRRAK